MFTTFHMGHYQPLTWLTLGIDYLIWGLNPLGYHLTNLLLHCINAVVLYFVAVRLFTWVDPGLAGHELSLLRLAAGFSALLFSVHPLRVESVAWATERRDVLSGLFFLLTILCYLKAVTNGESRARHWRWILISLAAYVLSLLAKASAMTLPVVLLILDVYPLRRLGTQRMVQSGNTRGVAGEISIFGLRGVARESRRCLPSTQQGLTGRWNSTTSARDFLRLCTR